jgi:hypothetical protein
MSSSGIAVGLNKGFRVTKVAKLASVPGRKGVRASIT